MTTNTNNYEKILKIKDDDLNLTLIELVDKYKISIENRPPFLVYDGELVLGLDYYYNSDGIMEFNKQIQSIKLKELKEYGYEIKNIITIGFPGGLGSTTLDIQTFIDLYNSINSFIINNPIIYDVFKYIIESKLLYKLLMKLDEKTKPIVLKKSINHKKVWKEKEFIKAYMIDKMDDNKDNQKMIARALLMYYGYEYKNRKWVLNEK